MRKTLSVALAALALACGGDSEPKPLSYGPATAVAPGSPEAFAAETATVALQSELAAPAPTQASPPPADGMNLADALLGDLNAAPAPAKISAPASAKIAQDFARQAVVDPTGAENCVTATISGTTITWTWGAPVPCHLVSTDVDGNVMTVDISGTLTHDTATARTSWGIDGAVSMTGTTDAGDAIAMNATVGFDGSVERGPTTFEAATTSAVQMHATMRGPSGSAVIDAGVVNSLKADLTYVADPFCITGGTLTVEQRPSGEMAKEYPAQGWQFTWTGCGTFTVAHGS